jgi:hypothetical protein
MCLETCFGSVPDPRACNASYRLGDLIIMMVAASLCGATTCTEFSLFATTRRDVLLRLIDYETAPSHDTFSRLLRVMDPQAFERAFAIFAEGFARALAETAGQPPQVQAMPPPDVSIPDEISPKGGADKFLDCLCCNSKIPAVFGWADPAQ